MENLKKKAKQIIRKKGFQNIKIAIIEESETKFIAKYIAKTHTIEILRNMFEIEMRIAKFLLAMVESEEEFLELVLCHELGHHLDPDSEAFQERANIMEEKATRLNSEEELESFRVYVQETMELQRQGELVAWELGRMLVSSELKEKYEWFNKRNMQLYDEKQEMTLKNLNQLLEKLDQKEAAH